MATSYGVHRAEATIAAARAGFADTLIIDADLAEAILSSPSLDTAGPTAPTAGA